MNITKMYGSKKDDVSQGSLLFVSDGAATYDCAKILFDLKLREQTKDIPDVSCKFDVVGVVPITEKATVMKS